MELHLESNAPPGSGLGGSSTVASVTAGLINHLREDKLDDYQLAEIAFQAERVELGIDGGWQDQYAAVFGGFNFIEFKDEGVLVHPLKIREDILNELECSIVLCFSGQTRVSGKIVRRQTKAFLAKNKDVMESLDKLHCLAIEIKNSLLRDIFLMMNGDTFPLFSISDLFEFYMQNKDCCLGAIALSHHSQVADKGSVIITPDGRVVKFAEKIEKCGTGRLVNSGTYLFCTDIFSMNSWKTNCSLEREVLPELVKIGRIFGLDIKGGFLDIGLLGEYLKFKEFIDRKVSLSE